MPRAQIEELLANGIDFFVLRLNAPILTTQPQETKPTENEKNHLKGLALLAKGQGAKALPWLQKAMDAQDSKIYRFDFARALLELHQYNKAESLFLSIIKNNPWDAQALLFRAIALQGMGDKNRSLADLTSAAYLAPHNEAIQEIYHYERSNMKKEKGSYILPTALKTFVAPDQKALVYLMLPKGLHVIRGKSSWGGWCALRSDVHFLGYIPEEAAGN